MTIFFYGDDGQDMGGGEWWNFFPPPPDFSADYESGEDRDYEGDGGPIPPEPDYEEGPFIGGMVDWYEFADGAIAALMQDAAEVDPKNIRGGGFTDAYEVYEWLENTGLLSIGGIIVIDGLYYPTVGEYEVEA